LKDSYGEKLTNPRKYKSVIGYVSVYSQNIAFKSVHYERMGS